MKLIITTTITNLSEQRLIEYAEALGDITSIEIKKDLMMRGHASYEVKDKYGSTALNEINLIMDDQ